nr:nitronate monooxygenase [Microbacterium immunditiarum]
MRDTLGIDAPIVLGPFGGLSSAELTAAVSELGGLGSYGLYGYSPGRIRDTIAAIRERTAKPFAVNLWLATGDEVTPADVDLEPRISELAPVFEELGLPLPKPPAAFLPDLSAQLEAVLDAAPAVLSVVYGVPGAELVQAARERGMRLIGTATTVAEAVALDEAGVDAIVATGAEAAGHRVSFLAPAEESLVGTFSLVPQVADAVRAPVIAAGGVADRRGVAAAFALGASGVQVGTAFLRTQESAAPPSHRRAIAGASDTTTVLTRAMSGRLARGIPNRAMRMLQDATNLPFPAQNWLTGQFRAEAGRRDLSDLVSLWAGQSAPLARRERAVEVFAELGAGLPG